MNDQILVNFNKWVDELDRNLAPIGLRVWMTKRPNGEVSLVECKTCNWWWMVSKKAHHKDDCTNPNKNTEIIDPNRDYSIK